MSPAHISAVVAAAAESLAQDGYTQLRLEDSFSDGCPMIVGKRGGEAVFAPIRVSNGPAFCRATVNPLNRFAWKHCAKAYLAEHGRWGERIRFVNVSARRLSGDDYALRRSRA